jgi:hypothetical protein
MIGIIIDRTLPLAELHTEKNKTIFTKGFYLQVYSRQKKSKTFFTKEISPLGIKSIGNIQCEQRPKQSSVGLYLRLNSNQKN